MTRTPTPDAKPVLRRHAFWALQIIGWLGYFVLHFSAAMGDGKPLNYVFASLSVTGCGFAVTSLLRLGYRRAWRHPTARMLAMAFAFLIVASIVQTRLYVAIVFEYCTDCGIRDIYGYIWYFVATFHLMLSWSGLYFGIRFAQQFQQQKELALRASNAAHLAQIRMLRYQINPHFLFNTLNAISTLVLDDRRDPAYRMIANLSAFLRHSLDADPEAQVPLSQELDALSLYLQIEQARFEDRLRITLDVDPRAHRALVPDLILQPLIENSIKHAVARSESGGHIELIARVDSDRTVELRLRDDGPGFDARRMSSSEDAGVGLANTRERLRAHYGDDHTLTIRNREPRGTEVVLRLPFADVPST